MSVVGDLPFLKRSVPEKPYECPDQRVRVLLVAKMLRVKSNSKLPRMAAAKRLFWSTSNCRWEREPDLIWFLMTGCYRELCIPIGTPCQLCLVHPSNRAPH